MTRYIVYVIYYDEQSHMEAEKIYGKYPWARLVYNKTTKYVESGFILDILPTLENEWVNKDYVGTISWKAHTKTDISDFENLDIALRDNIDLVYLIHGENTFEDVFTLTDACHPRFSNIWRLIMEEMGLTDIFPKNMTTFYCNYWLIRPFLLKKYINFGEKVRNIIESTPEIKIETEKNAMYFNPPGEYKIATGKKFYMYHPFIMERLPAYFAYLNNIKIRPYKRLTNFPNIKCIESDFKTLLIYVYEGDTINLRRFTKYNHNADCYYVLNTDKPNDILLENYIKRTRDGICEGWSDVILNIDRSKYDFFIFVNDNDHSELFSRTQWIDIITSKLIGDVHLVQFNKSHFAVDKTGIDSLIGSVFHPIIEINTCVGVAIDKARKKICIDGYYAELFDTFDLIFPKTVHTTNNTWTCLRPLYFISLLEKNGWLKNNGFGHFIPLYSYSTDILKYCYLYKNGGIMADIDYQDISTIFDSELDNDVIIGAKYTENGLFVINTGFIASKSHTEFIKILLSIITMIIFLNRTLSIEYICGNKLLFFYINWYIKRGVYDKNVIIDIYGKDIFENISGLFTSRVGFLI